MAPKHELCNLIRKFAFAVYLTLVEAQVECFCFSVTSAYFSMSAYLLFALNTTLTRVLCSTTYSMQAKNATNMKLLMLCAL